MVTKNQNPVNRLLTLLKMPDEKITMTKTKVGDLPLPQGAHVILGLPRSGKSTLGRAIIEKMDGEEYKLDEPIEKIDGSVYYGPEGLSDIIKSLSSSSKGVFLIDSLRTIIHSLSGPTQKGGISASYKEILTLINNMAITMEKAIILVITSDTDVLLDIRASVQSVTVIDNFKFITQLRWSDSMSSESQIFLPVVSRHADDAIVARLINSAPEGVSMYSYELTRRMLAGDDLARAYMAKGLPYTAYERAVLSQNLSSSLVRDVNAISRSRAMSQTEKASLLTDINYD